MVDRHSSTRTRSLIKGLIWEGTAPFILFIFTHKWTVIVGYTAVRIVLYYFYERFWKRIKWGQVK